ncbi:Hypothetical predicted protein [Paramuricea clavata]|uniref:Uncharacterized protein n=1 Tax=Paramuricea clavata TaxID=317549 RepID=A0A6S7GMI5_PARCT|nr:Hypothetical predicted protein [Paramuricea clavata]
MDKLQYLGLDQPAINWFQSYLSGRMQMCSVNRVLSDAQMLSCGVPQGTILGPRLFLIYINDLPSYVTHSSTRMFADDTNLNVSECSIPEIKSLLERHIQCVVEWLCANKLTLNVVKTEIMMVGSRQRLATHTEHFDLTIDGMALLQNEFNYNSSFWTNRETYAVENGLEGLNENQAKLASYWNTPFNKICLGMKVNGATKWIALNYTTNSLHSVIEDGTFEGTTFGKEAWKSLINQWFVGLVAN